MIDADVDLPISQFFSIECKHNAYRRRTLFLFISYFPSAGPNYGIQKGLLFVLIYLPDRYK